MGQFPCHPYASGSKVPVYFGGSVQGEREKATEFSFLFILENMAMVTRFWSNKCDINNNYKERRLADSTKGTNTEHRSEKMKTNEWTVEQLLHRERERSKRGCRKRRKPGTISIYLPRAPSIFLHNQRLCRTDDTVRELAMTPGQGKC